MFSPYVKTMLLLVFFLFSAPVFSAAKVNIVSSSDSEVVIEITGARCGSAWPGCPTDLERIMPIAQKHCDKFDKSAQFSGKLDFDKSIYRITCGVRDPAQVAVDSYGLEFEPIEQHMTSRTWSALRFVAEKYGPVKARAYLLLFHSGLALGKPKPGRATLRFGALIDGAERVALGEDVSSLVSGPDPRTRVSKYVNLALEIYNRKPGVGFTEQEILELMEAIQPDPSLGGFQVIKKE